ncbi:methylated-DNA--[protein]-cysteine S-methyltransferase [Tautonia marina]|uniref:methylated-DNA--[protein]-cysteine S-methyltransferase n=1 Tax=Tautonia marina TaxID=2653855 RepID=UPI001260DBF3|nr:methylated-DNA--[protein]-cysteine S-methyltransferase [Tautonia marina]
MTRLEHLTPDQGAPIVLTTARIDTPIGPLLAGAMDQGLALLEFDDSEPDAERFRNPQPSVRKRPRFLLQNGPHPLLELLRSELAEYFEGRREGFTVPLVLVGTPFEREAWDALQAIPYGETRSYAEQARSIGRASAVRAVGRANGRNRLAIVVPCHRVVASRGGLCGYNGGLWRKRFLIDLESRHAPGEAAQAGACCS